MSLDFTALDFETANSHRGSPCSVGLVKVRAGHVVEQMHTLIRPPAAHDYFDYFNTWLHQIDSAAVRSAPRWPEALCDIVRFVGNDVAVFHNAAFSLSVIRQACIADELTWPRLRFFCTLVAARHAYRLPTYRLPFVAQACGFEHLQRYDAAEDAGAIARIAVLLAEQRGIESIESLADLLTVRLGHMDSGSYSPSLSRRLNHGLVPPNVNPEADPDHPLYGRVVVFTGTLMSMTRQLAWEELGRVGGLPEPAVTKRTNVLVVGDINPAVLAPGAAITGKAAKAFALQNKGQEIEVMTEDDFLRSL